MKKAISILSLFLLLFTTIGCSGEKESDGKIYRIKYVVFYPGYRDTIESSSRGFDFFEYSDRGSNYISLESNRFSDYIYSGSAPYKIIEHTSSIDSLK